LELISNVYSNIHPASARKAACAILAHDETGYQAAADGMAALNGLIATKLKIYGTLLDQKASVSRKNA
jgi:hypothetical protein